MAPSARPVLFTETTPIAPSSPYSASKASADLLVLANHHTFGQEVVVTRCSNNYGKIPLSGKAHPVDDHQGHARRGIARLWRWPQRPGTGSTSRTTPPAFNASSNKAAPGKCIIWGPARSGKNIDIVKLILKILGKPESLISYVQDRPGHDRRYAIDSTKTRTELGWTAPTPVQ